MNEIKMGIYRHYRGPLYQVLGLAHDANALGDRTVVIYIGLQLDKAHLGPRLAVRNLKEGDDPFLDWVDDEAAPSMVFADGTERRAWRRFTYLGPELTAEMLE
jgi:hypothetical protein